MRREEKDGPYSQRHVCALRIVLVMLFKHLPAALQQGSFIISLDTECRLVNEHREAKSELRI